MYKKLLQCKILPSDSVYLLPKMNGDCRMLVPVPFFVVVYIIVVLTFVNVVAVLFLFLGDID